MLVELINIVADFAALGMAQGLIFALLTHPRRNRSNSLFTFFCLSFGSWALISLLQRLPESNLDVASETLFRLQIGAMVVAAISFLAFARNQSQKGNGSSLRFPFFLLFAAYIFSRPLDLVTLPIDIILVTIVAVLIGWEMIHTQVYNPLEDLEVELRIANRDLQQAVNELASEKKTTEELERDLAAAKRYKNEFLANMSHELRTPLNSIIGYSELLYNGVYGQLNAKQADRLEKVHRNGKRLLDLISNILDMNKIDAGKMKLDVAAFQLRPLVEELAAEIEPRCAEKGLALKIEIGDELPYLFGDEQRVWQVFSNLLDNAIKFTHAGEVKLSATPITVRNGSSEEFELPVIGWLRDGDWILTQVADTGIGIAPEDQARIFEEFSQVDGSHTREFGGSGLGLAIAKRLVEMHSGVIWVKSVVGQGSTFFIALPGDYRERRESSDIGEPSQSVRSGE